MYSTFFCFASHITNSISSSIDVILKRFYRCTLSGGLFHGEVGRNARRRTLVCHNLELTGNLWEMLCINQWWTPKMMPKANHKNLGDHLHQKNTVSVFLITTPAVLFVFGLSFVCVCFFRIRVMPCYIWWIVDAILKGKRELWWESVFAFGLIVCECFLYPALNTVAVLFTYTRMSLFIIYSLNLLEWLFYQNGAIKYLF